MSKYCRTFWFHSNIFEKEFNRNDSCYGKKVTPIHNLNYRPNIFCVTVNIVLHKITDNIRK